MRFPGILLLAGLLASPFTYAQTQSPYQLDLKRDLSLSLVGIGLATGGWVMRENIAPLDEESILELDPSDINGFDRRAVNNWSPQASFTSDYMLYAAFLAPFGLAADRPVRKDALKVAVMGSEAMLLCSGLTDITKSFVLRARPFMYNDLAPYDRKFWRQSRTSFFSGHTSLAATACFFTAKVYNDYHPESHTRYWVWGLAAVLPAATGYFRFRAGKHFPTDVITGYAVGAFTGWVVPHIHKQKLQNRSKVRINLSADYQSLGLFAQF